MQNTYPLRKPVSKRFPRNPYTVKYIDVSEMDLADLSSLSKFIDKYKYLLNAIHIFTECLEHHTKGQNLYLHYNRIKIFISR